MTEPEARAALVRLVRDEGRRVLATLARVSGVMLVSIRAISHSAAARIWPASGSAAP